VPRPAALVNLGGKISTTAPSRSGRRDRANNNGADEDAALNLRLNGREWDCYTAFINEGLAAVHLSKVVL